MTMLDPSHDRVQPPLRILVADADADTRALYATSLTPHRWDVIEAADGRDALVKALTRRPSAVITELRLPHIDGIALCRILRTDRVTADVPIAVVTGEARESEAKRALQAGADVVLTKPTRLETLVLELHRLIARSTELRERGSVAMARAAAELDRADELRAKRHIMLSRAAHSMTTTTPPLPPPELKCTACDTPLKYEYSFVGGISVRHPEQWDYYTCERCGTFQYRHRTRRLRRVG
jgi:DNA-binding response OmpR family regulator